MQVQILPAPRYLSGPMNSLDPDDSWRGLNEEQLRAVGHGGKLTLVNACAGSGKTATATAKVAGWVRQGVDPGAILMLTFTRKAAGEMKARIARRLGLAVCPVEGGTYHSTALRLMRVNPSAFALETAFGILDDDGAGRLWKKILKTLGGDPREAGRAAAAHGLAVNLLKDPEEEIRRSLITRVEGAAGAYAKTKADNRVVDFDDILVLWSKALSEGRGGRGRWTHVMVDEFQDNSELQYEILRRLGALEIFAVGDPNQCIYSFRGSAPKLMSRFRRDNPECSEHTLSLNYRSGQGILDTANDALEGGERPVRLTAAGQGTGQVHKYSFGDHSQEAAFIHRGILWRLKSGTDPRQIAVLFRSGHQSAHIEMALRKAGIPYRKYGGISLTEAADVKDYLSILRAWHNPLDRISMLRVSIMFPGVGEKGAEKSIDKGEPRWPAKAQEAGLWIAQAAAAGWPRGAELLAERMQRLFRENYPDDHADRFERVLALASAAGGHPSLADFLDHYSTGDEEGGKPHPEDAVVLSTIHSAKGLEWDDVFVTGAGSTQIPSRKAEERGETEEERRLLYVAVTRARKFLCVSYPELSPRHEWQLPTPFLPPEGWRRCTQ